ncbi:MAG TPA: TorF family putative porin [Oceanipulchritudo sp.]|nr:TorF family putative porin [Oceanipulchritudo sp.]
MKKITAILASVVAMTSIAGAQELSVSTTLAWESDYIFRGVRLADEYFAPSVDISYGDFYAGIWAALPVEAAKADGTDATEVDFYAGYGIGLNETISADIGFTYYTYPQSSDEFFDTSNTFEIYAGLSFEAPLSPAVYVFYDFDLEALTLEASGGHTVEVSEEGSVDVTVYLGYVEPDVDSGYYYYGAGVAYNYAFTENASASIGVNYYGSEEGLSPWRYESDKYKFTLTASFTAGF